MIRDADSEHAWIRVERVFEASTRHAKYYGRVELARANPLKCHAYTLKRKPSGRVKKTRFGKKSAMKHSPKNTHREHTPWLLVTSLEGGEARTKLVIRLYQSRM